MSRGGVGSDDCAKGWQLVGGGSGGGGDWGMRAEAWYWGCCRVGLSLDLGSRAPRGAPYCAPIGYASYETLLLRIGAAPVGPAP